MRAVFFRLQAIFIRLSDPPAWAEGFKVSGDGCGSGGWIPFYKFPLPKEKKEPRLSLFFVQMMRASCDTVLDSCT